MDKYENRRQNLAALMDAYCDGKVAVLAERLERSPSYVSRMLYPEDKAGKKRIGEDMAERIEFAFNIERGALDDVGGWQEIREPAEMDPFAVPAARVQVGEPNDTIPVKRVKLRLSAGITGFETEPESDDGSVLHIPRDVVEKHGLVPHCLLAIRVKGPSMEPMMFEDDYVIVNIADTKPISREVYALNFDGEATVKQLLFRNNRWYLHSLNPDFGPVDIKSGQCIIVGRVVFQPGRMLTGRL